VVSIYEQSVAITSASAGAWPRVSRPAIRIRPAHAWRRRASAFVHFLLARGDGEQRCATCGFALDGAIYAC